MNNKQFKQKKYQSTDMKEIKSLVIITAIIIAVAGSLYFLTERSLNKEPSVPPVKEAEISYTETILGTAFNKPEEEYFILAYDSKHDDARRYALLANLYSKGSDSIKIYHADLNSKFNAYALSDKSNKRPRKAEDIRINEVALIHFKNGIVHKFYETMEEIEKALS